MGGCVESSLANHAFHKYSMCSFSVLGTILGTENPPADKSTTLAIEWLTWVWGWTDNPFRDPCVDFAGNHCL